MQIFKQDHRAGSPIYKADSSTHARLHIIPASKGDPGWNKTMAYVEEATNQAFTVVMVAVLRISAGTGLLRPMIAVCTSPGKLAAEQQFAMIDAGSQTPAKKDTI